MRTTEGLGFFKSHLPQSLREPRFAEKRQNYRNPLCAAASRAPLRLAKVSSLSLSLPPLPLRGCSPGGRAVPRYVPLPAAPAGPGRGRGSTPPRLPAGAHACRRRRRRAACLPARLQAAAAAARSGTGRARRGGGGGAAAAARRRRRPALIYRAGRGAHPRRTTPLFKRFQ